MLNTPLLIYLLKCLHFFDLTHFYRLGQKSKKYFVRFLVQMRTRKFAFEINWPLVDTMQDFLCKLGMNPIFFLILWGKKINCGLL